MAKSIPLDTLLDSDKVYKSYRRMLRTNATDIAAMYDKLTEVHKTRGVRSMKTSAGPKTIGKVSLQDQQFRSELVGIRVELGREYANVEMAQQTCKDHISYMYREQLVGKTQEDRNREIRRYLARSEKRLSELGTLIEMFDMVIMDIDQAGWALRRTTDALSITNKGENY